MEIYVLDGFLRRATVIDQYVSFLWAERYSAWGDFELVVRDTRGNRNSLPIDSMIAIRESSRLMMVESAERKTDAEGEKLIVFKGRSLEAWMDQRAAFPAFNGSNAVPKWVITGTPKGVAEKVFRDICVTGVLDVRDRLPFYAAGSLYPDGNIPLSGVSQRMELPFGTVYEVISTICQNYDLGFRISRDGDNSKLYFNVYVGNNRTAGQQVFPAVVFSPENQNLQNTTSLTSSAGFKNVAYVMGQFSTSIVYAPGVDTAAGFDRRVLYVDASDINLPDGPEYQAALTQRGQEALTESRILFGFDGEISQRSDFVYERDYFLGDLVENRDEYGGTSTMRVTEQIFAADAEGVRSYPTLVVSQVVTPSSWFSWPNADVWADLGAIQWGQLP